ncbi:MAG TPA: hypothetical protein VMB52_01970 [Verrucomicrobiae bacterium]|nr:hypothetical protein [Verrucomicrobiae bacterium]
MFALDLLSWWYGIGWAGVLHATRRRLGAVSGAFSTSTLLHTLFAPWRRIVTYPGAGLEERLQAFSDNAISRFVGFSIRFFVLLAASVAFVVLSMLGLVELIVWPLTPILAVILIVKGLL